MSGVFKGPWLSIQPLSKKTDAPGVPAFTHAEAVHKADLGSLSGPPMQVMGNLERTLPYSQTESSYRGQFVALRSIRTVRFHHLSAENSATRVPSRRDSDLHASHHRNITVRSLVRKRLWRAGHCNSRKHEQPHTAILREIGGRVHGIWLAYAGHGRPRCLAIQRTRTRT